MPPMRSVLLALCLAPLCDAAPAPLARVNRHAPRSPWGEPVDGLRVRLVPPVGPAKAGQPFVLFLELQNVSGGPLAVELPSLGSYTSHPGDEPQGWAITARRVGERPERVRSLRNLQKLVEATVMAHGETVRYEITLRGEGDEEEEKKLLREGEDRKERLRMLDASRPGTYEFRATFRPHTGRRGGQRHWGEREVDGPPLRVELGE